MTRNFMKIALISAALSAAPIFSAALAETVEVMVLNTRGADGIYRPALRIVRGGTVTFVTAGDQGLTEETLRDPDLLAGWLGENVPNTNPDTQITFVLTTIQADPPASEGVAAIDCVASWNSGGRSCTPEEVTAFCARTATNVVIGIPGRQPITRNFLCD